MPRIVHVSDLHFGRARPELVVALERSIGELAPDLVVASGDLTQRARRPELARAAAFLERLPAPVLAVPGNHDLPGVTPKRFLDPWRRWRAYFPNGLEPATEGRGFIAVGANSARPWGPHPDWSRGRIDRSQLRRIGALLARAPHDADDRRLRLLAIHHPLLLTPAGAHRGHIGRRAMALAALSRAGLDLVLAGHIHLAYAGTAAGIVIAHAGTGVSDRLVGEPNGFNLITGDRRDLRIERWRWSGTAFRPASTSRFARSAGGWEPAPAGAPS